MIGSALDSLFPPTLAFDEPMPEIVIGLFMLETVEGGFQSVLFWKWKSQGGDVA